MAGEVARPVAALHGKDSLTWRAVVTLDAATNGLIPSADPTSSRMPT
jgi:hypothetical protein